jgi:hypothetical protein
MNENCQKNSFAVQTGAVNAETHEDNEKLPKVLVIDNL